MSILKKRAVVCKLYDQEWAELEALKDYQRRTVAGEIEMAIKMYLELNRENLKKFREFENGNK